MCEYRLVRRWVRVAVMIAATALIFWGVGTSLQPGPDGMPADDQGPVWPVVVGLCAFLFGAVWLLLPGTLQKRSDLSQSFRRRNTE